MRIYNLFLLLLICGTAISYTQIPGDGLVGYWSFNGHAYDASGFNNHGSVIGAVLTSDRFDRMYSAYYFDGNDVINVPHSESLIFEPSNSDYALSLWVQFDKSISDGGRIIQKWFGITEGSNYPFSIQANPESVGFLILSKTLNYVYYAFPIE